MMSEFKLKSNTHLIVKREDVEKYLTDGEQRMLNDLLRNVEESRIVDGKRTSNQYYICNLDEPYADKVMSVIKEGEESKVYAEYLGINGYKIDVQRATDLGLVVGEKYTVNSCAIGGWKSLINLSKFPNNVFNSVMFKYTDVNGIEIDIVERFRK